MKNIVDRFDEQTNSQTKVAQADAWSTLGKGRAESAKIGAKLNALDTQRQALSQRSYEIDEEMQQIGDGLVADIHNYFQSKFGEGYKPFEGGPTEGGLLQGKINDIDIYVLFQTYTEDYATNYALDITYGASENQFGPDNPFSMSMLDSIFAGELQ